MINGRVFDWESIRVDMTPLLDMEITAISYSSESGAEAVHGRGRAPRGYGRTNLVQEGSIDLPAPSFLILSTYALTKGGMFNLPAFPITVSYSNADQKPQIDLLPSCIITRVETDASQNDAEVNIKRLTLNILDPIKFNAKAVL